MRNLTISRTKSFVASLGKMKVYIEEPTSDELTINNVPCRKIGELKNGEQKTFTIDNNEVSLFVIADKVSKGYCNDVYRIPVGEEDVFLSGKNVFNLAAGHPFRFDGVSDAQTLQNRKKGSRIGAIVLCIAIAVGAVAGFFIGGGFASEKQNEPNKTNEPKEFTCDGMTILLNDSFSNAKNVEGYTACFDSQDVAVLVTEESFSLAEGADNLTIEQYGKLVIENNGFDDVELQNADGLTYFEFENISKENNENYTYYAFLYKSGDAFWMLQFATLEKNIDSYRQTFIDWAKTVEFDSEEVTVSQAA